MAGRRKKEVQPELFGRTDIPDDVLLRIELQGCKANLDTLQKQWEELWKMYETVRDENLILRRELGL